MIKDNYKDILFKIFIFIFMIIFVTFIIFTIYVVLEKGFPSLLESILDREIQYAIRMTLYTSTVATCYCLLFALPIAYGLARYDFWGKGIISAIIQIPNSIPPIASGIALLLFFSTKQIENFVMKLGVDPIFSIKGVIIAHFFINTPYMIRIMRITFEDIDPKLEFVARTLGYSKWGAFFKVIMPMSKKGLISAIIITWTNTLGEFGTALMLAGAIRMKTETLPMAIFLNISGGNLDKALSAATILIIISIVCLFLFESIGKENIRKFK